MSNQVSKVFSGHPSSFESDELQLVRDILNYGNPRMDRTGVGTKAVFGTQARFNMSGGDYPIYTTKKMFTRGIHEELFMFLDGNTNNLTLTDKNVEIWDEWALTPEDVKDSETHQVGDLGPIYSAMWVRQPVFHPRPVMVDIKIPEAIDWGKYPEYRLDDLVYKGLGFSVEDSRFAKNHPHYQNHRIFKLWLDVLDFVESNKGLFNVHPAWRSIDSFAKDLASVPLYEIWQQAPDDYTLSPRYYNSDTFAPGHVAFIPNDLHEQLADIPWADGTCGTIKRPQLWINQIDEVMDSLRERPGSRRHIVDSWNPQFLPDETLTPQENVLQGRMALAPCHCMFQFYVEELSGKQRYSLFCDRLVRMGVSFPKVENVADDDYHTVVDGYGFPRQRLSVLLYQRSIDTMVGRPFNISSYASLLLMFCQQLNMLEGDFVYDGGDTHIYSKHFDTAQTQAKRPPKVLPRMELVGLPKDIYSYNIKNFNLLDYESHGRLDYEIAV